MEELQEADVLWPDTPPSSRDRERSYLPDQLCESAAAAVDFSCESFGSDDDGPAASPSMSSTSSSTTVLPFGGGSSGGFLSYPSTFAGWHGGDGDMAEEFQEADVLWPDDGYAMGERAGADGGELWWLCCGFGGDAARYHRAEPAAGGQRQAWRPRVSSPIDIPTGVATAAARRRHPGAVLVHRGWIGTD